MLKIICYFNKQKKSYKSLNQIGILWLYVIKNEETDISRGPENYLLESLREALVNPAILSYRNECSCSAYLVVVNKAALLKMSEKLSKTGT